MATSQKESCESSLQWHKQHVIRTDVSACLWISHQCLAVCLEGCVKVYEVTTESSHLSYTLTSDEWKQERSWITGVAVSESLPDSMLVVCQHKLYIYQYPCHEATQEMQKYKIKGGEEGSPWCIRANANKVIIVMYLQDSLVVCNLPDLNHQSRVRTSLDPYDLSISTDHLLVMGENEMAVKALEGDLSQDLCRISVPEGCQFASVSFRNNAREIFVVCTKGRYGSCVYRYTWDGIGKPQYVNTGCVIDGLGLVYHRWISVTSDGWLALGECDPYKVTVYNLK